tara:strand:+ start:1109 stop:3364 length:2256 start_codon:yes stop_codon:yes gene_type:complete
MKRIFTLLTFSALSLFASAQSLVELNSLSTYKTNVFDDGAMEIVAYNEYSQRLYAINANENAVDVFDISNPTNIVKVDSLDLSPYGDAPNSVAFYGNLIAVAVEAADFDANGKAVFFDTTGAFVAALEVGVLPDMITFNRDGSKVLVANEGEPDDDYTADPEGSVSIIDMTGALNQAAVTTLDFNSFNANYDPMIRNFGPVNNFFEDFENTADSLNNLNLVMTAGDVSFYYDEFSGDHFVEANSFGSNGPTVAWLITPAQNLTGLDSAYFSFYSAKNFSGGDLDILVSTDYDENINTDPATATWDTITSQFTLSPGSYTDTFSGRYSLHNYLQANVSFAFYYRGSPGAGGSTLWQIDDINLEGTAPRLSQNLEPEYITVSPDNSTAFVVCQENNAMAVIDLSSNSISTLKSLGFKDWSMGNNRFDASNTASSINIRNWPVYGMYQPDAIKAFAIGGTNYVATANEGDARDYDAYSEEDRVKDLNLDPTAFPNASDLQQNDSLGRLNITTTLGDTDGDGDYDELYAYGARSFSIWDDQLNLVWDSGDEFAQTLATLQPANFNSNNDDNSSLKSRSDDKGSEPEAIEIAEINGYTIAFIGLERMGGVMVYDISNPSSPSFISYFINRDFSVPATDPNAGDLAPEDLKFIPAEKSPNGQALLVSANEVSGTLSIYSVGGTIGLSEEDLALTLSVYPNPSNGIFYFSQIIEEGQILNLNGQVLKAVQGQEIDLSNLSKGIYFLKSEWGTLQLLKN